MGQSATDSNQQTILSMKFLVVLAFAGLALAEPEADADAGHFYNSYYGYRPLSYGHFGYGYRYGNYYPHSYGGYHYYGKREAGAEAEADPALVYTNTFQSPLSVHQTPLVQTVQQTPLVQTVQQTPVVQTVQHTLHQTPVVQTVQTAGVYSSSNAFQTPVGVQTFNTAPVVNTVQTFQTPAGINSAVQTQHFNTHVETPAVTSVYNTNLKAFPATPAVSHLNKREAGAEAEAEADPALVYTTSTFNQGLQQHSVVQTPVVQTPLVYNTNTFQTPVVQTPVVYNTNTFQTPVAVQTVHQSSPVVSNVYNAALQTPLVKAFPSLRTTQVTHITKREAGAEAEAEAEADPAFVYTTNNFPITGVNTFNTAVPQFATVNQYAAVNPQFVTPQVAAFSHPITSINNLPVRCLNGLC